MKEDPTLLIDADIVAFRIASVSQKTFQFDPECEPSIQVDDWSEVVPRIDRAIEDIRDTLGSRDIIICLSCPTENNFRLDILPTYKGNRDYSKRPVHLAAVKQYLEANYISYRRPRLEADDIMGILSTNGIGKKIIVSEDKDMQTIPGWLFNPAKDTVPRYITVQEADRFHLYQTIVGDPTDCYSGCPGVGHEQATEILDNPYIWFPYQHTFKSGPRKGLEETRWRRADPGATAWENIVSLYEKQGLTEADALVQARVARILRTIDYDFNKKEPLLWRPN